MTERASWVLSRAKRYSSAFGVIKGVWYAFRDRPRAQGELELRWPGYDHPFKLRFGGSDLRTFLHVIVARGYEFPFALDPRSVVDAGANIGLSAVYFATKYPSAHVIALEPDADNFKLLCENTKNYKQVVPVQAALWWREGTVQLVDPGQGEWAFRVGGLQGPSPVREAGVATVPSVTITQLLDRFDVQTVDLLKMDIEGAEREVLHHSVDWIGQVSAIAIELHDRFVPGCEDAFTRATSTWGHRAQKGEDTFVAR